MSGDVVGHLLLIAGSFGFGIASALIPIINAEAYVLGVCYATPPWPASFAMVALVVGTLVGKLILFMGARHRDKLGRLLHRHGKDVAAAEARVGRRVDEDIERGEAAMEHAAARRARHRPDNTGDVAERTPVVHPGADPVPEAVPARRSRMRWPSWMTSTRRAIVDWGDRALGMLDRPWQSFIVLMTSASVGVPPLAVTTIAAGLRKTRLPIFIFCVVVGRAIRFGVIAVPTLLARN